MKSSRRNRSSSSRLNSLSIRREMWRRSLTDINCAFFSTPLSTLVNILNMTKSCIVNWPNVNDDAVLSIHRSNINQKMLVWMGLFPSMPALQILITFRNKKISNVWSSYFQVVFQCYLWCRLDKMNKKPSQIWSLSTHKNIAQRWHRWKSTDKW